MNTLSIEKQNHGRNLIFLFLLINVFAGQIYAQQGIQLICPIEGNWIFSPEFSDEFNGLELDKEKWMDLVPVWFGRQGSLFSPDNVSVKKDMLQLTCDTQKPEEVSYENKIRGFDKFRISIVKSKKRIRYGYFETRCKAMKANVCNAFFLYDPLDPPAKYLAGNYSEEIDIFEIVGKPDPEINLDRVLRTTVHRFNTPYLEGIVNLNRPPLPFQRARQRVPFDFHADFHVYGFLWTPTEMKWYLDGREVFSRANDFFHTPLHVVLDCETFPGQMLPDPADLPAVFYVDYVRIWQLTDIYPMIKDL